MPWIEIPDTVIRHIWKDDSGQETDVSVDFYVEAGTPIDEESGEDMEYLRTEVFVEDETPTPFSVRSHVHAGMVYGGMDGGAGLSLVIEARERVAHLRAHSGSLTPVDGPEASRDAVVIEAHGSARYCRTFYESDLEPLLLRLEGALAAWESGGENRQAIRAAQAVLNDVDLDEVSYAELLRENEPETHADIFGSKADMSGNP